MLTGLETFLTDITARPLKKGPIGLCRNVSTELPFYKTLRSSDRASLISK